MPQDTIKVNLISDKTHIKQIEYYNPLLVYKTAKFKINEGAKFKAYSLTIQNYPKIIDALEKDNGENGEDNFSEEKKYLKETLDDFFQQDGLKACMLLLYKDKAEAIKEYLKANRHTFVVLINTYKKNGGEGGDGLTIYKDDYDKFKSPNNFFIFSTKEKEIKELFKDKSDTEKAGNIVVYSNNGEHLHLKFISKYLNEASTFHSVNPYGIKLKSTPLYDDTLIKTLRDTNINFYSLLNETALDGVPAFKEGVDLAGNSIDEIFTYQYLKAETIVELIRVWNKNNRQNSKLSALSLSGVRENAYTSSIECLFKRFKDSGLIVSYKDLKLILKPSPTLELTLNISVTYNYSINAVTLNITTEDLEDYIK
ncbi:hypothetical protein DB313_06245 (plasmid) [Borrelia turcica IST7]|uniref:DUF787 family protein n=1 Tax=Borrelia turcica IST7 TaxID=1104446 RepID=A0A386PRQ3_9SPIR|nr:DUF787 family protein [Borrelia turcica]AYE37100.1 hypothetical protein DB313_06245 [Borrelia turcica IST7]